MKILPGQLKLVKIRSISMEGPNSTGMVDPKIFEDLQIKIDEDAQVKEQIRALLQILGRQGRTTQFILSRAHSTPTSKRKQPLVVSHLPAA
jgi:hypothetical protein